MSELTMKPVYYLTLDGDELTLVLRSLRGALIPEEEEGARELCNKLTIQRGGSVESFSRSMHVHTSNALTAQKELEEARNARLQKLDTLSRK
jgi:hypothetical protein